MQNWKNIPALMSSTVSVLVDDQGRRGIGRGIFMDLDQGLDLDFARGGKVG